MKRSICLAIMVLLMLMLASSAWGGQYKVKITVDYGGCLENEELVCPYAEANRGPTTENQYKVSPKYSIEIIEDSIDLNIEPIVRTPILINESLNDPAYKEYGYLRLALGLAIISDIIDLNNYTYKWTRTDFINGQEYIHNLDPYMIRRYVNIPLRDEDTTPSWLIQPLIDANQDLIDQITGIFVILSSEGQAYHSLDSLQKGIKYVTEITITKNPEVQQPNPITLGQYSEIENDVGFIQNNDQNIIVFQAQEIDHFAYSFVTHWKKYKRLDDDRVKCHAVQIRELNQDYIKNIPGKKFVKKPKKNPDLKEYIKRVAGNRKDDVWVIFNLNTNQIEESSEKYLLGY